MIPGEVTLTTAPLVDTRVARFNRAPDGQLRIALVDTATGLEFGSFVLTERTVQAVERATAAVRAVRDKLAQGSRVSSPSRSPKTHKQVQTVEGTPVSSVRLFWPDGRMRPMPGDKVWTMAPGLLGPAPVEGQAIKQGSSVKIAAQGKRHPASERWSVVGDPVVDARRSAVVVQKQADEAEKQRIMHEAVAAVNAHARFRDMVPVEGIADVSAGDKLYRITSEGEFGDGDPQKLHETLVTVSSVDPSRDDVFYYVDENGHERSSGKVSSWWRRRDAPRANAVAPYEVDTLDLHISNTVGCYEKMQRIKASAARSCAEGRYDRSAVLRDVAQILIAPCAQGLRAQLKRDESEMPTHNAATLAAVAERFVRRIESELFEEEGRKCATPPVADPHEVTYLFDVISNERDLYETRLKIEEAMSRGLDRAGALRRITAEIVSLGAIRARRLARGEGEAAPTFNVAVREEVAKQVLASAEESIGWRTSRGLNAPSATYAATPASQASPAAPRAAAPRAAVTQVSVPVPAARPEAPPAPRGKVRVKALADDVMEVLRNSRVDGNAVRLPDAQLDPKLYQRVAEALENIGAPWNRKAKAHLFTTAEASGKFGALVMTGVSVIEKGLSYFPTPAMLAARVAGLAGAGPGRRILEPSAGEGAIVAALLSLGAEVVAVEYDATRAATLRARFPGITVVQGDFLAMRPAELGFFDGVAMNPPFSLAGQPQADIDHVMHAATFAHRGGLVAAIVSQGVEFRDDKKSQAFRAFVAKHGGAIETLPQQSFRETGTDVNSSLVTFVSPGVK